MKTDMLANWFEAKIKYVKVTDEGREKKVTEDYLLDALTYTEAEARVTRALRDLIQGDFYIAGLKKSNITELVESPDERDDKWYKAKVAIIDADQLTGREKRANQYYLIAGGDIDRALENLKRSLETYVVPWEIASLAETRFMDVFPYFAEEDTEGLTPLGPREETEGSALWDGEGEMDGEMDENMDGEGEIEGVMDEATPGE